MTSLGIVDLLDPRVQRAAASPSPSRQITPGAAAFADVILDASRVDADAAEGTFAGASPEGDTADAAPAAPSTPATNIPPAIVPLPEPTLVLPVSVVVIGDATGEVPAAAIPAPQRADAADAPEGAVTVVAAESAASAGSIGAPAAVAGTTAPASPVETAPAQPAVSETTRSLPLATTTTSALDAPTPAASHSAGPTAKGVLGTAEPALPRTASTASRIGVSSGPISGIPVVAGAPSGPVPSAHAGAQETDAVPPALSPDAPTTPAPAISASAPAPAASASTGDAPVPPAAVGSTPPPTPVAAAAPAAAAAPRPALLPQITAPVISLAQAPDGDHSLTLTVSPENLGPVTVRAHISGGAIHIELHAPNDLGREALRAILVDLRRDLAAAAPQASLLLSTSDDGPASSNPQHSAHNSTGGGTGSSNGATTGTNSGEPGAADARGRDVANPSSGDRASTDLTSPTDPASPAPLISPHGGIDVFA